MEDAEFARRMDALEAKLEAVYVSSERLRKFFMWTVIISTALFVFPFIGLLFAIPSFISTYSNIGNMSM
jgi:hypothetical protein